MYFLHFIVPISIKKEMDVFSCRIRNKILFFLFVYFIPMIEGPSTSSTSKENDCPKRISEVFRLNTQTPNNKTAYLRYAVLNLRHLKPEERKGYIQNLQPDPPENYEFALLDGNSDHSYINTELFSYKYFEDMAQKFQIGKTKSPTEYCYGFPTDIMIRNCHYSLLYFGLSGETEDAIRFAILHLVQNDITSSDLFRYDMTEPAYKTYAGNYLIHIAKNLSTNENSMWWPSQFCSLMYVLNY